MRRARIALAVATALLVGCREQRTPAEVIGVADAGPPVAFVAPPIDAGAPVAAVDPGPSTIGPIDRMLFSRKGRLAFLIGETAFAVVDTQKGTVRRYRGEVEKGAERSFDDRCEVSLQGYNGNGNFLYVETDPAESLFVRKETKTYYREDLAHGTTLRLPDSPWFYSAAIVFNPEEGAAIVLHDKSEIRPLRKDMSHVNAIDSGDAVPRTALVDVVGSTLHFDDLVKERTFPTEAGEAQGAWLRFDRSLLVTRGSTGKPNESRLCTFDLGASSKAETCVKITMVSPFFRMLVSDDAQRIAFAERIAGKNPKTNKVEDSWDRYSANDECFVHVLDRRTGKEVRWKGVCTTTTETPLRFEGDVLVTNATDKIGCTPDKIRRYDIATGALRGQKIEPAPPPDDIDDNVAAVLKKLQMGHSLTVRKQQALSTALGLDEVVTWSEGGSVLARKGGDLVLCKKRGGTCGAAITGIEAGATGGASPDGSVLGAIAQKHFIAVSAATGAKLLDIPIE